LVAVVIIHHYSVTVVGLPIISRPMMVLEVSANANTVATDSAVREISNPCSNHENVGLMVWPKHKIHDKKIVNNKQTIKM